MSRPSLPSRLLVVALLGTALLAAQGFLLANTSPPLVQHQDARRRASPSSSSFSTGCATTTVYTKGRMWMQSSSLSDTLRVTKDRGVIIETTATEHLEAEIEGDAHAFQQHQEEQRRRKKAQAQAKEYKVGVIVVDHGSRRAEANNALAGVVNDFQALSGYELVEPAHMELAEPSIATAFGRCVERGATFIICHPFFLSRGRHVQEDIPTLLEEAASIFPGVEWALSKPLGLQSEIPRLMQRAVEDCVVEQNIQSEDHAEGLPLPEFNI